MTDITQQDRIRLAEFIGRCTDLMCNSICGKESGMYFSPDTDANDCDALIRALNDKFISVTVTQWASYGSLPSVNEAGKCGVRFNHVAGTYEEWTGDNYMQGVCELALKVIDDDLF